jgi:hypothetical protein
MAVVRQAVEHRAHGSGVAEELSPVVHGTIRRDSVESRVKLLVIGEVG